MSDINVSRRACHEDLLRSHDDIVDLPRSANVRASEGRYANDLETQ